MKYLYTKDDIIFAECENCGRILKFKKYLLSEINSGIECFCGNNSDIIHDLPQGTIDYPQQMKSNGSSQIHNTQQSELNTSATTRFTPKCPTCGSTNIQKISLVSKALGGYMWGIFSSNIRNTFKCNNCGYKW